MLRRSQGVSRLKVDRSPSCSAAEVPRLPLAVSGHSRTSPPCNVRSGHTWRVSFIERQLQKNPRLWQTRCNLGARRFAIPEMFARFMASSWLALPSDICRPSLRPMPRRYVSKVPPLVAFHQGQLLPRTGTAISYATIRYERLSKVREQS